VAKHDKRPPQRQRRRTKPTLSERPVNLVRVAVVTSPQHDPESGFPTLAGDVSLVKAAVLYADQVELLGLAASMVHSIGLGPTSRRASLEDMVRWTELLRDDVVVTPEVRALLPLMTKMLAKPKRIPLEMRAQAAEMQQVMQGAEDLMTPMADSILESTGAGELRSAIDSGLVTVADLGVGLDEAILAATGREGDNDAEVRRFVDQVRERLADRRTRLVFDDGAGELMQELLADGTISADKVALSLAGKGALGTGLVARLPAFTTVKMDELLEMRADLSPSLARYRSAVSEFSGAVSSLAGDRLRAEVDGVWEEKVAPAIVEVESLLHDHGLVRELAKGVRQDVGRYLAALGGCWIGVAAVSDLGHLATSALAATPEVAHAVGNAWQRSLEGKRDAEVNQFYYLYAANKRLES
jgi:hypothetical protein